MYWISHNYVDDRDWAEGETGRAMRSLVAAVFAASIVLRLYSTLRLLLLSIGFLFKQSKTVALKI